MSDAPLRLARCLDLAEGHLAAAIASREGTRALLARLAEISAPDTGVAKVLLLMARMSTTACTWIEGDLRVELVATGEATVLDTTTDIGGGLLERVLPRATLRAPLAEFARAIDRVPRMIAPLTVVGKSAGRIVLTASSAIRRTTTPPPAIEIAPEALYVRLPAPPRIEHTDDDPMPLPVVSASSVPPSNPTEPPLNDLDEGWGD
jgi:hypothetical protein